MFDSIAARFTTLFERIKGSSHLSQNQVDSVIEEINDALLSADVPQEVVKAFLHEVTPELKGQKVLKSVKPGEQIVSHVYKKLVSFLGGDSTVIGIPPVSSTIMVMGLQGAGKTTTIGKLARLIIQEKKLNPADIVVGSVDFYRPAAIDQLEIVAKQVGAQFYRAQATDALMAAKEIKAHAVVHRAKYLLLDTAGRLHTDQDLLKELQDITSDIAPERKILILDAMMGQESLNVARTFYTAVGFDGAILTKMDSHTRSGAAFAFYYSLKLPIYYVGVGEKAEDLTSFIPARMAQRMLGMGDVQSLLERADREIKENEKARLEKSLMAGRMTLQDFADQIAMVGRLGSMTQLMQYMPGLSGKVSEQDLKKGEIEIRRFRAIIDSMTLKEKQNKINLDLSRKKRIAAGAGVKVADIDILLDRFEKTQQFVKLFKKFGNIPGFKL